MTGKRPLLTGNLLRRLKLLRLSNVQAQLEQLNLLAQLRHLGAGLDGLSCGGGAGRIEM